MYVNPLKPMGYKIASRDAMKQQGGALGFMVRNAQCAGVLVGGAGMCVYMNAPGGRSQ